MILTRNLHPRNLHLHPSPPLFPNHLFPVAFLATLREGSPSDLNRYWLNQLHLDAPAGGRLLHLGNDRQHPGPSGSARFVAGALSSPASLQSLAWGMCRCLCIRNHSLAISPFQIQVIRESRDGLGGRGLARL